MTFRQKLNWAKKVNITKEVLAWVLAVIVLIPFYIIIVNSLKTSAEANLMNLTFPKTGLQFENYRIAILEGKLIRAFINSTIITVFSVSISVILTSMSSFVLARNKTRRNTILYYYLLIGILGSINMVAVIRILKFLHLLNSYPGVILLYVAMFTPFSTLISYNFISTIPSAVDEAAVMDGCGGLRLFFQIVFPLLKPIIVTMILLNFMGAWNNFIIPLYILNDTKMWPMPLAIFNFYGMYNREWNLVFATLMVTMIPIILVYIVGQKYIISGMSAGSIKG